MSAAPDPPFVALRRPGASRDVTLLSVGFLLLFFGYTGAQQYVTTYFAHTGQPHLGFQSLILVYGAFALAGPLGAAVVSAYGAKRAMLVATPAYALFLVALTVRSVIVVGAASVLLGVAAALLHTAQNSYLVRATAEADRGTSAGVFSTMKSLGSAAGVILLGLLIGALSYRWAFLVAAMFPCAAMVLLSCLRDLRSEHPGRRTGMMLRVMRSRAAWRLSTIWFATYFVYGLAIGVIPIDITTTVNVSFAGVAMSLVFVVPILLSYVSGRLSDTKGRVRVLVGSFAIGILGLLTLYLAQTSATFIVGIALIATYYAARVPATIGLLGDVTTPTNLDHVTSFFVTIQIVGVVAALALSAVVQTKAVYIIASATLGVSLWILLPVIRGGVEPIRAQIAHEVG